MRVLHITPCLAVGGLEKVVVELCAASWPNDIQVLCASLAPKGELAAQLPRGDADFTGAEQVRHRFLDGPTLRQLRRFCRAQQIDLLHAHNHKANQYGALLSLLTGCPLVVTVHGRGGTGPSPWRHRFLYRLLLRMARQIVAVSADTRQKLITRNRLPATGIRTIINGVDTSRFSPATPATVATLRQQCGLPPDAFIIGSVGRLAAEKNYPLLVQAVALLRQQGVNAHLAIVGEGTTRHAIEQALATTGLQQHCSLPGARFDIVEWMRCFDLFTLSSDTEGTAITLLEAMACGLTVVATDVGGNREVVNPPSGGLLVPPRDAAALAAAFLQLHQQPATRAAMGQAGRARIVEHYSRERMIQAYADLYHEVLPARSR